MKRLFLIAFTFMVLGFARLAFCAEIIGKVADAQGTPVTHVRIAVINANGKTVRTVTLNEKGIFAVDGLSPGEYQVMLHPAEGGSLGGIIQFHLGSSGITFIWRIRPKESSLVLVPGDTPDGPGARAIKRSPV